MSIPASPEQVPDPGLVDSALIASLEGSHSTSNDLFEELKSKAPEIALWLRRRAVELSPAIGERELEAQLALEVAKLCLSRTAEGPVIAAEVGTLEALFTEESFPSPAA